MKATIYHDGFLGIVKTEAHLQDHGRAPYAQWPAAPFAVFVPKGKRLPRQIRVGYRPFLLILAGWGHPDAAEAMIPTGTYQTAGAVVTMQRSRYGSCDPRWRTDFNAKIDKYLADNPAVQVIADYRTPEDEPAPAA